MIKGLTQSDINDIANGYHNRFVESLDKDELIKYLASKVNLDDCDDEMDIEDEINNIESAISDIRSALDDVEVALDNIKEVI